MTPKRPSGRKWSPPSPQGKSRQEFDQLASATGGLALVNRNSLERALSRIVEDQRSYYLIGFEPPRSMFSKSGKPKFHKIKLKIDRPGVRVRTRAGFYGVTDAGRRGAGSALASRPFDRSRRRARPSPRRAADARRVRGRRLPHGSRGHAVRGARVRRPPRRGHGRGAPADLAVRLRPQPGGLERTPPRPAPGPARRQPLDRVQLGDERVERRLRLPPPERLLPGRRRACPGEAVRPHVAARARGRRGDGRDRARSRATSRPTRAATATWPRRRATSRRASTSRVPQKPGALRYPPDTGDGVVYQDEFVAWVEATFPRGGGAARLLLARQRARPLGLDARAPPPDRGRSRTRRWSSARPTTRRRSSRSRPRRSSSGPSATAGRASCACRTRPTRAGATSSTSTSTRWPRPSGASAGASWTCSTCTGTPRRAAAACASRRRAAPTRSRPRACRRRARSGTPTYVETSWISQDAGVGAIRLLPRLREKIAAH